MHHADHLREAGLRSHSHHGNRALARQVTPMQMRRRRTVPRSRPGDWPRRRAAGAAAQSPPRRRVDFRSGVHRPAGSEPGSSPGRRRRAGPLSRSSSDSWRYRSRRLRGARTGRGCSATSPVNSTTAGSTTATCPPSRPCSTPSTMLSVAESAPAEASPHRRHGPTDRGDIPDDGGDRARCQRHPSGGPSQSTGRRREPGETSSCLAVPVTKRPKLAPSPMDVPRRPSASGRRR